MLSRSRERERERQGSVWTQGNDKNIPLAPGLHRTYIFISSLLGDINVNIYATEKDNRKGQKQLRKKALWAPYCNYYSLDQNLRPLSPTPCLLLTGDSVQSLNSASHGVFPAFVEEMSLILGKRSDRLRRPAHPHLRRCSSPSLPWQSSLFPVWYDRTCQQRFPHLHSYWVHRFEHSNSLLGPAGHF